VNYITVLAVLIRTWTSECSNRCFSCIPPDYWFDGNFKEAASSPVYLLFTEHRQSRTSFNSKSKICLM